MANVVKASEECYRVYGKDLDGCSTQENEGCGRCPVSIKLMECDLCHKELHPLDAHTGYIKGKLSCVHIDCWNEEIKK